MDTTNDASSVKKLRVMLPQELIPIHPEYDVQDWDSAEGAIDWSRMVNALRKVKETGVIPPEHYSHDHLNEQKEVPVEEAQLDRWREVFTRLQREREEAGEKVVWVIVDGFLLYWNKVRVCLSVFRDRVLKGRRRSAEWESV
ncbi:hypothetical protein PHLCEN_2v5449 [Hermanssonia centrifuga]|uniref:Uncharacterized protein n=1 Tax=Hermanssonia centrifuga TaxID=98765 RepID=A0A2R6P2H7_9APHY|nr:hypothetical protein PHLCEN_2v5449 [Hermanssonia centrifuga]